MTTRENQFKGDISLLSSIDIDGPLKNAPIQCCEHYFSQYQTSIGQADADGDGNSGDTFRFLQAIVSMRFSIDTPDAAFVPGFQLGKTRSMIPSDLSDSDISAVRELSKSTHVPSLKARLQDILWEHSKDHNACSEAAAAYMDAADLINNDAGWSHALKLYRRGLWLASKLGKSKELFAQCRKRIIKSAEAATKDETGFRCHAFMTLLLELRILDSAEHFASVARELAQRAMDAKEFRIARGYWEVEAQWQNALNRPEPSKHAQILAAETYIAESENRATGVNSSYLAASIFLTQGIEALRQAGGKRDRVEQLKQKLTEYQKKSVTEMKGVSAEIDISAEIERSRDWVRNADLQQSLFKFAMIQPLVDLPTLRKSVVEIAKQTPMSNLFPTWFVDEKGRPKAIRDGLLNLEGEAFEERVEQEMFAHASQFHWPTRVNGFIEPARQQILNDHHPTYQDLFFLVHNNPFVPPGHQIIFLQGIHAGFCGDFVVAAHLLVPQIENSLRHLLELHGVDVSNLFSDGTRPVKVLGALLGLKESKHILSERLHFELRGSLIEKSGFDFRNRLAHGFVSEAECYSPSSVMIWWLVVRICVLPILHALSSEAPVVDEPEQRGNESTDGK